MDAARFWRASPASNLQVGTAATLERADNTPQIPRPAMPRHWLSRTSRPGDHTGARQTETFCL